jgi:hypothetical protein
VNSGTTGQIGYYAGNGTAISGTSTLPNGTTAITQTQTDASTKVATTAYVDTGLGGKQATLTNPVTGPGSGATSGHGAKCTNAACTTIDDIGYVPVNPSSLPPHAISFSFGQPGGSALSAGILGYVTVPFGCTISGWSIEADAGTDTVKFLKVAAGTAIPTIGSNSISTSGVALSSGTVIQSTTVTDFTTTTVTANDVVAADLITTSGTGYINAQLVCQ